MPFEAARLLREARASVRLALPLMLAQLSLMSMNVVDTVLAGHHGAASLGAVAVGSALWSLVMLILLGVLMAVPAFVAQLVGAGRRGDTAPLFRQALWLGLALSLPLFVLVRSTQPLLLAIGIEPEQVPLIDGFLKGVSWGTPAVALFMVQRGLSDGLSLTRPGMYFGVLGLALLVPLGWAMMFGRMGFAEGGPAGLGRATAVVLWVQALGLALYLRLRRHYRDLDLFGRLERPDPRQLFDLLRIGVPMGVTVFMEGSLFVVSALMVGVLGALTVAAHQIANNVASVAFMVPLGLAMASTVRVGEAVGRDDARGVRYAAYAGLGMTLLLQSLSATVLFLAPMAIVGLYTPDPAVRAIAAQLIFYAAVFQFSDGIQVACNGALRGLKDTRVPMILTLFAYWLVGMPLGYGLAFPLGWGAPGVWVGLIAGLSVAALLLYARFWYMAHGERWERLLTRRAFT
ncbi:MAG TPA: MATE family efflux transporter [Xanthomonadaceae bacterium]|nr:MATE family efflux transporter [Xanthomonadaceae bacterium]